MAASVAICCMRVGVIRGSLPRSSPDACHFRCRFPVLVPWLSTLPATTAPRHCRLALRGIPARDQQHQQPGGACIKADRPQAIAHPIRVSVRRNTVGPPCRSNTVTGGCPPPKGPCSPPSLRCRSSSWPSSPCLSSALRRPRGSSPPGSRGSTTQRTPSSPSPGPLQLATSTSSGWARPTSRAPSSRSTLRAMQTRTRSALVCANAFMPAHSSLARSARTTASSISSSIFSLGTRPSATASSRVWPGWDPPSPRTASRMSPWWAPTLIAGREAGSTICCPRSPASALTARATRPLWTALCCRSREPMSRFRRWDPTTHSCSLPC